MLVVLFTKMSSEEVMGDKSLIFNIIGERSRGRRTVITAAVVATTHPRIINRSLVACDAAGPTAYLTGGETRRDHVVVVHTLYSLERSCPDLCLFLCACRREIGR